ncbi:hypothetical protein L1049_019824 [Liquidambar formosana]|uniref:Uncharacterized protein n=1 Tax=Liquidambar formosana TaxID=63359 RepID=A0AAP0SD48_LIQFO
MPPKCSYEQGKTRSSHPSDMEGLKWVKYPFPLSTSFTLSPLLSLSVSLSKTIRRLPIDRGQQKMTNIKKRRKKKKTNMYYATSMHVHLLNNIQASYVHAQNAS